ncbi:MAG: hypothetical protein U0K36_10975 [Bacteroidales bacterium]|nr:hypothetical protein [Bacteroidales bacterium]
MAVRRKSDYKRWLKVETLPIDLRRLADEPLESLKARVDLAAAAAVSAFDTAAGLSFTFSGKDAAPMNTRTRLTESGVSILCVVSGRAVAENFLVVRPDLSRDTTGLNRQPILASGRKGQWVEVPSGFIWNHRIFRSVGWGYTRIGYYTGEMMTRITSARPWLVNAGADPSPANVLASTKEHVFDAAMTLLLEGIDNAG